MLPKSNRNSTENELLINLYKMRNKDKLNFIKQIVKECDKQQLTLTDVVKSFYCECNAPLIRTNGTGGEYCSNCNLDLEQ